MFFASADDYHEWHSSRNLLVPAIDCLCPFGRFSSSSQLAHCQQHIRCPFVRTAAALFNDLLRDMDGEEYLGDGDH